MLYFILKNPFLSSRISIINFNKLVKAHLAALTVANTDGSLTTIYQESQRLYDEFVKQTNDKSTIDSVKKGQTENVDSQVEIVRDFIAEQEPNIEYQFRKDPGKYAEFYPNGLTEYRRAGKDKLITLFTRFVKACTLYPDKVGTEVITEAQHLLEGFEAARGGQVKKKETVKSLSGAAATSQQALAVRLYRTLGLLISIYADQPDTIHKFFDFSFLPKNNAKKEISTPTT